MADTAGDARIDRKGWLVLAICCGALFMTTLDNTILNVALPRLRTGLSASPSGLQWTVDGYVLARATLLFFAGSLGDRYGRRKLFTIGLIAFTLASLACSLAPTLGALVAFRAVQGVGSALMTPASLAIITNRFTDRRRRARAVGVWSATTGLSTAAGPVLGGLLVETLGWRSVFWVNVPVGIVVLAGVRTLDESTAGGPPRKFDVPGQLAIAAGLAALTYALIAAPKSGWGSPLVVALAVVAVGSIAVFIQVERRTASPMLELRYFRDPVLSGAVLTAIVAFLALGGFLFFNTLYLQDVRGYSPLEAGFLTVPVTIVTLVCAPLAGRITGIRGPRIPVVVACGCITVSMAVLSAVISRTTPLPLLISAYAVLGAGTGLVNPPITNAAVSSMPASAAGVAAATTSTARQIGTNLGVALLGAIVFSAVSAEALDSSKSQVLPAGAGAEFASGLSSAYAVAAGLAAVCGVICWRAFRSPQLQP